MVFGEANPNNSNSLYLFRSIDLSSAKSATMNQVCTADGQLIEPGLLHVPLDELEHLPNQLLEEKHVGVELLLHNYMSPLQCDMEY